MLASDEWEGNYDSQDGEDGSEGPEPGCEDAGCHRLTPDPDHQGGDGHCDPVATRVVLREPLSDDRQ